MRHACEILCWREMQSGRRPRCNDKAQWLAANLKRPVSIQPCSNPAIMAHNEKRNDSVGCTNPNWDIIHPNDNLIDNCDPTSRVCMSLWVHRFSTRSWNSHLEAISAATIALHRRWHLLLLWAMLRTFISCMSITHHICRQLHVHIIYRYEV